VVFILVSLFAFSPIVKADEGMWLLMYLDSQTYKNMKSKGLKLSAKQIYDINKACLKDAIMYNLVEVVQERLFLMKD
jgi:hypothetical protein